MTESSNGCVSTLLETCLPETVNRDEKDYAFKTILTIISSRDLTFPNLSQACRSQATIIKAKSRKRAQPICFDSHTARLGAYPL